MSTVDIDKVEVITRFGGVLPEVSVDGGKTWWYKKDFEQLSALLAANTTHLKAELLAKIEFKNENSFDEDYINGWNNAITEITKIVEDL